MQFAQRIKVRWVLHSMIDGRGARIRQLSGSALSARARWGRLLSRACAAQHQHSASTHALAIVATRRSAARESQQHDLRSALAPQAREGIREAHHLQAEAEGRAAEQLAQVIAWRPESC